jgi:hypothetical protein
MQQALCQCNGKSVSSQQQSECIMTLNVPPQRNVKLNVGTPVIKQVPNTPTPPNFPVATGPQTATNLSIQRNPTTVTVVSSTGENAVIPVATNTNAGVMSAADKVKLDAFSGNPPPPPLNFPAISSVVWRTPPSNNTPTFRIVLQSPIVGSEIVLRYSLFADFSSATILPPEETQEQDVVAGFYDWTLTALTEGVRYLSARINSGPWVPLQGNSFTIQIPDSAPVGQDVSFTFNEDTTKVFTVANFPYNDQNGDPLFGVRIVTLPAAGSLVVNNGISDIPCVVGDIVQVGDINASRFKYIPPQNAYSPPNTPYTSFKFAVRDNGATDNEDVTARTCSLVISAVNDPPAVVNPIPNQTFVAGFPVTHQVPTNTFNDIDNTSLTYSATLSPSGALPAWLSFNAGTRTFTGTIPAATNITVRVTATDGALSAFDDFVIQSVTANAFDFGALTLSNAGDIPIPVGATSITGGTAQNAPQGYKILSGQVVANANGSAKSGTIVFDNGVTWTMNAIPDAYSVATKAQTETVLALGNAVFNAGNPKTIYGRPGAQIGGTAPGNTVQFASGLNLTQPLTIRSHDPANKARLRRVDMRGIGEFRFTDMNISDTFVLADTYGSSGIFTYNQNTAGASNVIIERCDFSSNDVTAINNALIVGSPAAVVGAAWAHTNGVSSTVIQLTNNPDLSGVLTDRSQTFWYSQSFRPIVGVDNVAKTITVASAVSISATSATAYKIGWTPQVLRAISAGSVAWTHRPELTVTNSKFINLEKAISITPKRLFLFSNVFDLVYNDHLILSLKGDETEFVIRNNLFMRAMGTAADPINPHVDGCQIILSYMTQDNVVPILIEGNRTYQRGGRAHDQQFLFAESGVSPRRVLIHFRHNITLTCSRQGIVGERLAPGSQIMGNTLLMDQSVVDPNQYPPDILTNGSAAPADDGVLIRHNICGQITTTASAIKENNYTFGGTKPQNTSAIYSVLFNGTNFDTDSMADLAAFMAAVTPKPGVAALNPAGLPKIGAGHGYWDYTTGTQDSSCPY